MKVLHNGRSMRVGVLLGVLGLFAGAALGQAGTESVPAPAPAAAPASPDSSAKTGSSTSTASSHKKKRRHKSSSTAANASTTPPAGSSGSSGSSMTSSWPSLVSRPVTPASEAPGTVVVPSAGAGTAASFPKAASEKPAEPAAKPAAAPVDNTPVNLADEASVIAKLDRLGYLYYNSYETEPDGGATIRALDRSSGALLTLHFDRSGRMTPEPGWKQ